MRVELIDGAKKDFPVQRLCQVLGASHSGYFAWRARLPSPRQRQDMALLAHVRSAFSLSNGTYGSPRVTWEPRDQGLAVGRRRTARLMRDNGLQVRQKAALQANDGQRACLADRSQIFWTKTQRRNPESEMVGGYFHHMGPRKDGFTWRS